MEANKSNNIYFYYVNEQKYFPNQQSENYDQKIVEAFVATTILNVTKYIQNNYLSNSAREHKEHWWEGCESEFATQY